MKYDLLKFWHLYKVMVSNYYHHSPITFLEAKWSTTGSNSTQNQSYSTFIVYKDILYVKFLSYEIIKKQRKYFNETLKKNDQNCNDVHCMFSKKVPLLKSCDGLFLWADIWAALGFMGSFLRSTNFQKIPKKFPKNPKNFPKNWRIPKKFPPKLPRFWKYPIPYITLIGWKPFRAFFFF